MAIGAFGGAIGETYKWATGTSGGGFKELQIQSSCFTRLAHNEETGELIMQFTKGGVYTISNIPAIEVERWTQAESVGKYFNENIRGNY